MIRSNNSKSKMSSSRRAFSLRSLFRRNPPHKRSSPPPADVDEKNSYSMVETFQHKDTLRSLVDSRHLEKARQELSNVQDRSQPLAKPKISSFPGYFPRQGEQSAIERTLNGEPSFTVVFGAGSVGKTAVLREVLSHERYHVLHLDLRLAGFADIQSLYTILSQQMEFFFARFATMSGGYKVFDEDARNFKHARLDTERRASDASAGAIKVTVTDLARLMELFQSSLSKYSEFKLSEDGSDQGCARQESDESSDKTRVEPSPNDANSRRRWLSWFSKKRRSEKVVTVVPCHPVDVNEKERPKAHKKIPVLFVDEAQKLLAMDQPREAMKCLLESLAVLTKQDKLCHVVHATNDPFYQTWLRQLNVLQHCKILTLGDCTKSETRSFFHEQVLARVPERLQPALDFEILYDAFGGKLMHLDDYITDYVNSNGNLDVRRSSHFLQAHSFLNLHIIHSSQASTPPPAPPEPTANNRSIDTIHPALGPAGLKVYSPSTASHGPAVKDNDDRATVMVAGYYDADFSAMQLLKVMSRLTQPAVTHLPYFLLCREIGVRAVDGMVRGKVLDLRWTETVTKEGVDNRREALRSRRCVTSSGTIIDIMGIGEADVLSCTPVPGGQEQRISMHDELDEVVVPKLVPITPIMKYAMREVVQEYEDEQTASEYASLSDVDEY